MGINAWLGDNEYRAFPLEDGDRTMDHSAGGTFALPDSCLVDFVCLLGPDVGGATIGLDRIARSGGRFTFEFRGDGLLAGLSLRFDRPVGCPEFATDDAEAVLDSTKAAPEPVCGDPLVWEGTLTTGLLEPLEAILAEGESLTAVAVMPIEPVLAQETVRTYVRSLNLANLNRLHAAAPTGCPGVPGGPYADGEAVTVATCLRGKVRLRAGYNAAIRQSLREQSVTVSAQVGAGAGEPCAEVPAYPGETPPSGSTLLTGGPACDEVVSSINGLSAAVLRLEAGRGMKVAPHETDPHRLVVAADFHDLVVCPPTP